jgi:hypothetical protein
MLIVYHYPQPPKASATARFREVDFSLVTTTIHNSRKRAPWLVFGEYDLSLATTIHNPRKRARQLVFGGITSHWQPQPPKTSASARFREVDLSLVTTTTHNSRKRAPRLVFGGMTSLRPPPPPTTPENEPSRSFSGGMTSPWQPPPPTTPENEPSGSFLGV